MRIERATIDDAIDKRRVSKQCQSQQDERTFA